MAELDDQTRWRLGVFVRGGPTLLAPTVPSVTWAPGILRRHVESVLEHVGDGPVAIEHGGGMKSAALLNVIARHRSDVGVVATASHGEEEWIAEDSLAAGVPDIRVDTREELRKGRWPHRYDVCAQVCPWPVHHSLLIEVDRFELAADSGARAIMSGFDMGWLPRPARQSPPRGPVKVRPHESIVNASLLGEVPAAYASATRGHQRLELLRGLSRHYGLTLTLPFASSAGQSLVSGLTVSSSDPRAMFAQEFHDVLPDADWTQRAWGRDHHPDHTDLAKASRRYAALAAVADSRLWEILDRHVVLRFHEEASSQKISRSQGERVRRGLELAHAELVVRWLQRH